MVCGLSHKCKKLTEWGATGKAPAVVYLGKQGLGQIDAEIDNSHGLPLPDELMKRSNFPSWHSVAVCRKSRLVRDGEVPFIR